MNGPWSHSWICEIVGLKPGQFNPCSHYGAMVLRVRSMEEEKMEENAQEKK